MRLAPPLPSIHARTLRGIAVIATLASFTAACGNSVQVGANAEKARELTKEQASADANPSDDPVVGTPVAGATAGQGANLTCFGAAPTLDAGLEKFCAIADPAIRDSFATAFATICDEKKLVNLFLPPCAWNGAGTSDKHRRVIDKTALSDQASQDFRYFAAYSVNAQSSRDAMVALIKRELTDPDYPKTFVAIKNSSITNVATNPDGSIDYSVELANSSATIRFRARVVFAELTPDLVAIFDYGISDYVVVKEHHFLHFVRRIDDTSSRIVGIDEKVLADGGNHAVAYTNLTDVLKQRMERDYENSLRD